MTKMRRSPAPIIAAVLLLLPVLYVGSYLALVVPQGKFVVDSQNGTWGVQVGNGLEFARLENYRVQADRCSQFFWPLEQIDRKVRPGAWEVRAD